jgi:hypothetical protein
MNWGVNEAEKSGGLFHKAAAAAAAAKKDFPPFWSGKADGVSIKGHRKEQK